MSFFPLPCESFEVLTAFVQNKNNNQFFSEIVREWNYTNKYNGNLEMHKQRFSKYSFLNFKSFLVSPTIAGVDSDGSPEDVIVILNSPTSLVCEAYSYPPATITWFKDGTPLESNRNIRILPGNQFPSDA